MLSDPWMSALPIIEMRYCMVCFFDPVMSVLPIFETPQSQVLDWSHAGREHELGLETS